MAKKKKSHKNIPRRLNFNQKKRLQAAKTWIPSYTGKNIVLGYRHWFGTSLLCAALELKLSGVPVADEYIAQLRQTEESAAKLRQKRREKQQLAEDYTEDSDDFFAYIAGYTSGGAAYGVTWEEMEEFDEQENLNAVDNGRFKAQYSDEKFIEDLFADD